MATASCMIKGLDLDKPLKSFKRDDLNFPKVKEIAEGLTEYKQIASYNWFGIPSKPIIIVPGAPKRLLQWSGGQLKRDEGELLADENHFMMPSFPMEPLFQAIKLCNENDADITFQNYDIVTDRNNLRKLFEFVNSVDDNSDQPRPNPVRNVHQRGGFSRYPRGGSNLHRPSGDIRRKKEFRIDVQRLGNLICLIRCQDTDKEKAPDQSHPTFGSDFERKCSESIHDALEGSYRQIVGYKLGSLKFIVRFEVDCADYDKSVIDERDKKRNDTKGEDSIVSLMASMTFSDVRNPEGFAGSDLCYIPRGSPQNKYHLVELATRIFNRSFPTHTWPQMFFSGTETLVIGWQRYGKVEPNGWKDNHSGQDIRKCGVEHFPVEDVLEKFGGYPTDGLNRLHNFLSKLLEILREASDEKMFSVYWQPGFADEIKIYELSNVERRAVPDGLKRFISQN